MTHHKILKNNVQNITKERMNQTMKPNTYIANYESTPGSRLKQERKKLDMTQQEFSKLLCISTSYLSALERNIRPISASILHILSTKLSISSDYILYGTKANDLPLIHYIHEPNTFHVRHRLNVMLGTCNANELYASYSMIHSYLSNIRNKKKSSTPLSTHTKE